MIIIWHERTTQLLLVFIGDIGTNQPHCRSRTKEKTAIINIPTSIDHVKKTFTLQTVLLNLITLVEGAMLKIFTCFSIKLSHSILFQLFF